MQGFPIGGSRIRLSWGRSQCKLQPCITPIVSSGSSFLDVDKAAQAAAQAAQAAAMQAQAQYQVQMASQNAPTLTAEQAMQLLEKFGIARLLNNASNLENGNTSSTAGEGSINVNVTGNSHQGGQDTTQPVPTTSEQAALDILVQHQFDMFGPSSFDNQHPASQFGGSVFSPFSPDPSYLPDGVKGGEGVSLSPDPSQDFVSSTKGYAPWYSASQQDEKVPTSNAVASGKVSPTSAIGSRPGSARAFGNFLTTEQSSPFPPPNRASSRAENVIARPELVRKSSHPLPLPSQDRFGSQQQQDFDTFHDINGAFANLSVGDHGVSWKSSDGPSTSS